MELFLKIVFTSALLNNEFTEIRQKEYITSFERLKSFGYDVYLIETVKTGPPSFFENYTKHVYYSNTHDASIRNIGVREAAALTKGFEYYSLHTSAELILKLSGRYLINRKSFLEDLEMSEYDVVATTDSYKQVFFGCFAMRGNLFYQMLNDLDYVAMEQQMINIESEIARYIEEKRFKKNYVKDIGVSANIANSGVITNW